MKLQSLLKDIYPGEVPSPWSELDIGTIASDSRKVSAGSLFVALKGPANDGIHFIPQAVKQGASVVLRDQGEHGVAIEGATLILNVQDARKALRILLKNFYSDITTRIRVVGVTGTNGKTTITYLLESIFNSVGKPCGVIGTVNYRYAERVFAAKNTTPGPIEIHELLGQMHRERCVYCAMEVSSHALDQGRTDGIDFRSAIFTNLTSDHLDYHKDREEYFFAKSKLFTGLADDAVAVINRDDPFGEQLVQMSRGRVRTYGIKAQADFMAKDIRLTFSGTDFLFQVPDGSVAIRTPLVGLHNVYNILAAGAAAREEGLGLADIKKGIESLSNVPGRLERVDAGQPFMVLVDYAHTEDALKNVLTSLREVNPGRIILVFGCGGDRDRTKRPLMGRVAGNLADFSIITNDNPRREDPSDIVQEIIPGFQTRNFKVILDRREAIEEALRMAHADDVVLIAGKGHEDYQIFKERTIPFDERRIVRECLENIIGKKA